MKEIQKELILHLAQHKISLKEFLKRFPISEPEIKNFVLNKLKESFETKSPEDVEYALLLGFTVNLFWVEHTITLCKLLLEEWHFKHEDIILILQDLKDPISVDYLYKSLFREYIYLEYDQSYSLARKVIHALADIKSEEAREKLQLLASSDIDVIRDKAGKQLSRLGGLR